MRGQHVQRGEKGHSPLIQQVPRLMKTGVLSRFGTGGDGMLGLIQHHLNIMLFMRGVY
jgi:hypothetical protein